MKMVEEKDENQKIKKKKYKNFPYPQLGSFLKPSFQKPNTKYFGEKEGEGGRKGEGVKGKEKEKGKREEGRSEGEREGE